MVTVIYCLDGLVSRDHQLLLNLAQVPSIRFLNTHSSLSWFKMNGTPPSLEEKVRHCGEEQEYRDQLSHCHSRHRESLHDWADDDVSKQDLRVEMGMKSGDNMVGG